MIEKTNSPNLQNYIYESKNSSLNKKISGHCSMRPLKRTAGYITFYDNLYNKQNHIIHDNLDFDSQSNSHRITTNNELTKDHTAHKNESRFDVFDLLDMVNPLQHIPIVNHAYRYFTGDTIKPISSIIGSAVFAGPIGAASELVISIIGHNINNSPQENIISSTPNKYASNKAAIYKELASYNNSQHTNDANYDFNV